MNELLQKHGCSNVFTIPDGLRELMSDISREVLREQPIQICDFIANYLSALLITREHGVMAVKILDDLCDCQPSVTEHLIQIGMKASETRVLSEIIHEEIKSVQMIEGKEKVKEAEILKRILKRYQLDEVMTAKVCQIARNAYRDYWYRKKMLEEDIKVQPDEPWEIAAQHTLEVYKRTKPSFSDLTRATQKIQAAYRGYHVRRQMLNHLKPKKPQAPKVDLLGPPVDIAESREIDLGHVVDIKDQVRVDDMRARFTEDDHHKFGIGYDTMMTITHEPELPDEKPSSTTPAKHTGLDELPPPPPEPESHIKFGPPDQVEEIPLVDEIPDVALPAATDETPYDSEHPTPTFDTMSVPTSPSTTAPTSDIEDLAASGTEEEE